MVEQWRDIPGYEGFYQVSNFGKIKRVGGSTKCRKDRILKPGTDRAGYKTIVLSKDGHIQGIRVHRLVVIAFMGNRPKMETNHKDGNKANNHLDNLEWATRSDNLKHRYRVLKQCRDNHGEKNPNARLTYELAQEIRDLYKTGDFSQRELGEKHGVSQGQISKIILGKEWITVQSNGSTLTPYQ